MAKTKFELVAKITCPKCGKIFEQNIGNEIKTYINIFSNEFGMRYDEDPIEIFGNVLIKCPYCSIYSRIELIPEF